MPRKAAPWFRVARSMWHARVDGKQVPLNVTDPNDEGAAWAVFQQLVAAAKGGQPPGGPRVATGNDPTCAEAVAAFLADRAENIKADTVSRYGRILSPFVARFGTIRVSALDPKEVEKDAKRRASWSDTTRANYLATVEQVIRSAGRSGFRLLKPRKRSAGPDSVIPEAVYEKLLVACVGDWRAVIRFLWLTGCRPSEAASVTAEMVDWSAGVVRFDVHKTSRHDKPRLIYLCPESLALLQRQREKHKAGHLFRGKGGKPFSRQAFVMKFTRLSLRVGHHVTAYKLRHTYCTRALEKGVPEAQVAALVGHASTQMLSRHYNHLGTQARTMKAVAAKLNEKPPDAA